MNKSAPARIRAARLSTARILIGIVLFINVQCALSFFSQPGVYAPWYELKGISGEAAIQGYGVLFLMWNIPYIVALIHPQKYRISLFEAIAMQAIGLIGETLILQGLPTEHLILRGSLVRFIAFDGGGLGALVLAALLTRKGK